MGAGPAEGRGCPVSEPVKHTPGPWEIVMHGIHPVIFAGDKAVADVAVFGDDNARLIAAAPDLLAALENVLSDIESLQCNSEGVAGLHKNGDIADWNWLEQGWLSTDHLKEALLKAKGGAE